MLGTVVKHTQGNMAKVKSGKLEIKEKNTAQTFSIRFSIFCIVRFDSVKKHFVQSMIMCRL